MGKQVYILISFPAANGSQTHEGKRFVTVDLNGITGARIQNPGLLVCGANSLTTKPLERYGIDEIGSPYSVREYQRAVMQAKGGACIGP